eukprot:4521761-Ditylum_brightwellii.AAC.1
MQGPPSYTVAKTLLKGNASTVFTQAEINHGTHSVPHFELCMDDMAEHVFPKKARQTQKPYMRRNLRLVGEITVKEWVAWVLELNKYLKKYSHSTKTKSWTSLNIEYQRCGIESLLYRDLTQWTKS